MTLLNTVHFAILLLSYLILWLVAMHISLKLTVKWTFIFRFQDVGWTEKIDTSTTEVNYPRNKDNEYFQKNLEEP